jgi:cytochrome c oxidase cbb3-type subunit 3
MVYPAWPLITGFTSGFAGYSSRGAVMAEMASVKARRAGEAAGLASASLTQIRNDPKMLAIALAQGKTAFGDNCAPCHGSGGAGAKGFPVLADDDWLWGNSLDEMVVTLTHGIRAATDDQTRSTMMPAFGKDGILKRDEIAAVASHVRTLARLEPAKGANPALGARIFAENCAVCHGAEGKGDRTLGAPNLTDAIWLYGSDVAAISATIHNPRNGVMPAWGDRLDPVTIKSLALYVQSLGGGR